MKINCTEITTSRTQGFTLMELLVTLLVMGILLAIAVPSYVSARKHADTQTCRDNMATIYQAEKAFQIRSSTRDFTTSGAALGGLPTCPRGSNPYTLAVSGSGAASTVTITCDNTGAHQAGQKMATSNGETFINPTYP